METAVLIRDMRLQAGLSQEELADRARTSQPTIAAYEAGRSTPRIDTLDRLAQACGFDLSHEATPRVRRGALPIAQIASQVRSMVERSFSSDAWRLLIEFADDFRGSGLTSQRSMVREAPELTGDSRFDAALAGLVEFLCSEIERPHPAWTEERERFVEPWWFVSGLPGYEAMALRDSPVSFARHGVFINEGAFDSV